LEKKQQILAAALALFVEFGFHGTPTAKVAQDAGVANGTLFHHYKTKDELVVNLYNSVKEELAAYLSEITHESDFITPKFKNIFTHTLYWALQNRAKFYYIRQFEVSPHYAKISADTIEKHGAIMNQLITEGVKKKLLQTRPVDLMLSLYNSNIFGIYQYIINSKPEPEEQQAAVLAGYEMVWDMLRYKG